LHLTFFPNNFKAALNMDYSIETLSLDKLETDCVMVGIYANRQLTPSAAAVDAQTHQIISNLIERGDIKGKNAETLLVNVVPDSSLQRILIVGLGETEKFSAKLYRKALAAAVKTLKHTQITSVACTLAEVELAHCDWTWKTRQIVEVFSNAVYQFSETKSIKPTPIPLKKLQLSVPESVKAQAETGLAQGAAIAEAVNHAKLMADLPGNICTPTYLAHEALKIADSFSKMNVEILGEAEMQKLGMGALLSVSRGSRQEAKFICLHYQGGAAQEKPVVLIGKGLTFDSGGVCIKPAAGMDEMKYDMCGGATVISVLEAAARLDLPLNVVGLVPSSENMPDGDANKPGDIVTTMSGKTVEVINTDAEGRLLLCDALAYTEKFNPDVVIDVATLTGACVIALGKVASGLFANDDDLADALIHASETSVDSVWRMPLWEEYQEQLKSNFADMANVGGRDAGSVTAACFLARFAEDFRWAHLDIAGTAWRTGNHKGATGRPVPLLVQFLLNRVNDGR
jgi:leucyl aminopeptidase